jgi:hypothetical protein
MTLSKQCKCRGCTSGTHGLGKSDELGDCTTRYADAPYLWEKGICPACLTAKRQLPRVPRKIFMGKSESVKDFARRLSQLSDAPTTEEEQGGNK